MRSNHTFGIQFILRPFKIKGDYPSVQQKADLVKWFQSSQIHLILMRVSMSYPLNWSGWRIIYSLFRTHA